LSLLTRLFGTDRVSAPVVRLDPPITRKSVATSTDTAISAPNLFGALGYFGSSSGIAITPATALTVAAVYACTRCLSDDLAKLPVVVQRRTPGGGWRIDNAHALNRLLRKPNRWQTAFKFKAFVVTSYCLRGNAYIAILRDNAGRPRSLIPISPDRVGIYLSPEEWLFYGVSHPLIPEGQVTLHQEDVIHVRGMSLDGYTGISPIAAAAESIGLAIAAQQHGATLFRNGAQAGGC
jgi:HK97 family phage portal protein